MEKKKFLFKRQYSIIEKTLAIIIIMLIAIIIEIVNEKSVANEKLEEQNTKVIGLEQKVKSSEEQILKLGQNDKQKEIKQTVDNLKKEQESLETQKKQLETEINTLKDDIIKLKGEPKTYPAGHLTAGTDIPIGKYKIYGGKSNFVVYSSSGSLKVNIILGSGSFAVSEYIYTFSTGDRIQANSSFKLVSIE